MIGAALPLSITRAAAGNRYFPTGYTYRRRIEIPAAIHRLSLADGAVVVPFIETQAFLKTVANGGKVQNANGYDIRFEADGAPAKLPHALASFNATTGRVECWIRIPGFVVNTNFALVIAYGNASVTQPEADPAACWAGYLWSVDMSTGLDAGPNDIDLTLSNVVAGTIGSMNAGDFSSS